MNEHTCTANPLKLKEYMATGRPVVTTPMPEALRYAACLHVATDGAGFVDAIERELAAPSDAAPRRAALEGETWRDKAALLSTWIEEGLAARNAEGTPQGGAGGRDGTAGGRA